MTYAKTLLAAAALLSVAGTASAQTAPGAGAYAGVGVDAVEFDAYNLSGRVGYNFNEFFGVEGQAGFGIIDDKEDDGTIEAKAGFDYFAGAFGVVRAPVTPQIEVLGRAGYYFAQASVEAEDTATGETLDGEADFDGFAIGAGAQYNFGAFNESAVRAEYTYLDIGGDDEFGGTGGDLWSVAYIRRF